MSKRAESLVWERSRAGKTDLLAVIKIADLADDDGRNAFIEVPALARAIRASERGALYVLHRLEQRGEIEIEVNHEGRYIELRGGRQFRPKWFLHVRCVCAWEAYQLESAHQDGADDESEKIADSEPVSFPRGRPSRAAAKSEKIAHFAASRNPQSFPGNPKPASEKSEKTRTTYKERSVSDPLVIAAAAAAEDFRLAWNDAIAADRSSPIPIVSELTPERIEVISEALDDRPLAAWKVIFARVAESSFLSGYGKRGFVADLWWLLRTPEPAVQVMDGKYDDHFSDAELGEASARRFSVSGGRCTHTLICRDDHACLKRWALALRRTS
jgi:hypothetical protein